MTKNAAYHLLMCLLWIVALFLVDHVDTKYFVVFALGANCALLANDIKQKDKYPE